MPLPFPGMNLYLESLALWSEVYSWLIVELARLLNYQSAALDLTIDS
ncbi:MAG: DUF4058 family protein [Cyanobacteria bacterium J06635_1]